MPEVTNWREQVEREMDFHEETWEDVVGIAGDVEKTFLWDGFGSTHGEAFTVWTARRVYFPVEYDGAEGVNSVPRHPASGEATWHIT